MSFTVETVVPRFLTVADVLASVSEIPASRIRVVPAPGTAVEDDVARVYSQERRLCELVDGILVEKTAGAYESFLAVCLIQLLGPFIREHDLGVLLGADGMLRLAPGLVRIPDVAFIGWEQLPQRVFPRAAVPNLHPDLAIEVLSKQNTRGEMQRKLQDYFAHGARLVWYLDPDRREMRVFTSPQDARIVGIDDELDGGDVLPGLSLPLARLFDVPLESTDERAE